MKEGWKLITDSGLVLDPPTPLGEYLGCGQFPVHVSPAEAQRRLEHVRPLLADVEGQNKVKTNQPVKAIRYNMFGFFRQCDEVYCDLANIDPKTLRKMRHLVRMTTSSNQKILRLKGGLATTQLR